MFGCRGSSRERTRFQLIMFRSEYGPEDTSVLAFTHSTGWLPMSDIIR